MDRKITIVFFEAGGGHRSAAEALKAVLESQQRPWQVELLNLQELLDRLDVLKKLTGLRIQDGYNLILRNGWTRLTPQLLPVLQSVVRVYHGPTVKVLTQYWKEHPTDLVLSVIPHFNRAMVESVRKSMPGTPFVTLITDLADYPPHFWIEKESEYLICGSEKAEQQAFACGHDRDRVFLASGMIMRPKFYAKKAINRAEERKKLGLDPSKTTGIVLFGGHGSSAILHIATSLNAGKADLQLILMCGKNQNLLTAAKELKARFAIHAVGFTQDVDHYMALSDFFIGKPGPGSISEALQFNLPVIVECNGRTLPQERYNAQWVTEKKLGVVLNSFRKVNEGVEKLLEPAAFAEYRSNASAYKNNALHEIPEFLDQIAEHRSATTSGSPVSVEGKPALQRAARASLTSGLQLDWGT
jgi:glycosyl transferase family 28/monogalactosyldiacylglycerol (MGDG) synthase